MTSNKQKVIQAAAQLFHEQGFQATGLEEILSRSSVCKSNFYYHFKSKDELGLRVIEQQVQMMEDNYIGPTLNHPELAPGDRLRRFFELMIRFTEEHDCRLGCIFGNLTLELSGQHERMRERLSGFFHYIEERIEAALLQGVRDGSVTLHGMSEKDAAVSLLALLQGSILLTKGHQDARPLYAGLRFLGVVTGDGGAAGVAPSD